MNKTQPPKRPNKPTYALDCKRLQPVYHKPGTSPNPPTIAYVDRERGWVIQIWESDTPGCNGTPWEGTYRVSVKHTRAKTHQQYKKRSSSAPITWDDLQAIKDYFWPNRIAIEVYPPRDSIVDVADMRWLWVLPAGAVLPFNLTGARYLSSPVTATLPAEEAV